ncbi:MAG: hypothetical protein HQL49_04900 [Gammaproteobacteria bacterium]|nr:hypothetical protein [Gammaproteobacteria bacterium]
MLLGISFTLLTFADSLRLRDAMQADLTANRQLVRDLALTDLALFTDARYVRHLSQQDNYAAFQDHPMALEHFPSGSLIMPPQLSP